MYLPLLKGAVISFLSMRHVVHGTGGQSGCEMADAHGALASGLPSRPDAWKRPPIRKAHAAHCLLTCSLLREENEDRIAAFSWYSRGYKSLPVREW